ncbi:MAG: DUF5928 domain-containing protein [Pseudomonadota bacterium]
MTQIAYLILAHKDAAGLIERAKLLSSGGDKVAIHFDRNAARAEFETLRRGLRGSPDVVLAPRVRCGWGTWSLVQATLNLLRIALDSFGEATHFYLISGDCTPIKPRAHIAQFLGAVDRDFIEHNDFLDSDWIKIGLKEERLIYRHYVNERTRKWLFYALLTLQKRLGLSRRLPVGLRIHIGSQWWVLRRATAQKVMAFANVNPKILRFFRTTWIPDETFFQTLVPHLTPRAELENRPLTFIAFSDYGLPMVLYDDHADLLAREDHLFARKVAPGAVGLRRRMAEIYALPAERSSGGVDLRALYDYYTWLGRNGQRVTPRIWEMGRDIGAGRELCLVLAKQWWLGKRFIGPMHRVMPAFGYLFDEDVADLPALGGLSEPRSKRSLHRRAFLHLLFVALGTERLMFCLDPGQTGIIDDLARDPCRLTVLEIETPLSDAFLAGHAARIGLMPQDATDRVTRDVVEALRRQIAQERHAVDRLGLRALARIGPHTPPDRLFAQTARFLNVTETEARGLIDPNALFA